MCWGFFCIFANSILFAMNMLLFISGQELMIVLLAVLLLFGSKKIPEFAKGLGKGMREFRKATEDIKRELNNSASDISDDIKDIKKNITE